MVPKLNSKNKYQRVKVLHKPYLPSNHLYYLPNLQATFVLVMIVRRMYPTVQVSLMLYSRVNHLPCLHRQGDPQRNPMLGLSHPYPQAKMSLVPSPRAYL
jgi:hypothetical protein